jgi:hypothetical protein
VSHHILNTRGFNTISYNFELMQIQTATTTGGEKEMGTKGTLNPKP